MSKIDYALKSGYKMGQYKSYCPIFSSDLKIWKDTQQRFDKLILSPELFTRLATIKYIFIFGSSGSGKTTLLRAIADANIPNLIFLKRYMSRARRVNDDTFENYFTSRSGEIISDDEIHFSWKRDLPGTDGTLRQETYSFLNSPIASTTNNVLVCSGNNALLESPALVDSKFNPASRDILWVQTLIGYDQRETRLRRRSPDFNGAQIDYRLADYAMRGIEHADVVIPNISQDFTEILQFIDFIKYILLQNYEVS